MKRPSGGRHAGAVAKKQVGLAQLHKLIVVHVADSNWESIVRVWVEE
jgi:hypothetical protein